MSEHEKAVWVQKGEDRWELILQPPPGDDPKVAEVNNVLSGLPAQTPPLVRITMEPSGGLKQRLKKKPKLNRAYVEVYTGWTDEGPSHTYDSLKGTVDDVKRQAAAFPTADGGYLPGYEVEKIEGNDVYYRKVA